MDLMADPMAAHFRGVLKPETGFVIRFGKAEELERAPCIRSTFLQSLCKDEE